MIHGNYLFFLEIWRKQGWRSSSQLMNSSWLIFMRNFFFVEQGQILMIDSFGVHIHNKNTRSKWNFYGIMFTDRQIINRMYAADNSLITHLISSRLCVFNVNSSKKKKFIDPHFAFYFFFFVKLLVSHEDFFISHFHDVVCVFFCNLLQRHS